MSDDPAQMLQHVERWRQQGIPPPASLDQQAFAEALALSAALSVALAAESDDALAESLRQRLCSAADQRGHSSSLRMRIARGPRQRRPAPRRRPLLWMLPVAVAALLLVALLLLPGTRDSGGDPGPAVVEQLPPASLQPPAQQVEAQQPAPVHSAPQLAQDEPDIPRRLDDGMVVMRPIGQAAELLIPHGRMHIPAASVVTVSVTDGAMSAEVEVGEALVEIDDHGPVRILASQSLDITGDGLPIIDGGQVVLDLSAQAGRIRGQRRDGVWQARFDPQHQVMALDIERFADPLPLRGDEWLQVDYRLSGAAEWMGVYAHVRGMGHDHWSRSWPPQVGWQSLRIPLADLQATEESPGVVGVWGSGLLLQLRFQAGMSSDAQHPTVLELRSLRLMTPLGGG